MTSPLAGNRFRIDRFSLSKAHLPAFLQAVASTHALLRTQTGFVRDTLVQRPLDGDRVEVLTLAEWDASADVESIAARVRAEQRARGFDARATLDAWEIHADLGWFSPLTLPGIAEIRG